MLKKVMRFMDIGKWIKRNASTLLTCLGAGGMVTTIALAIKVTPKAYSKVVDAKIDKAVEQEIQDLELPKLTVLEMIRVCWRDYLSTVAIGTGSLVCFFGANALSRRQQTSMAAAYTALVSAFEGYRDKVKAICGPGTDVMIEKAVEQEKQDIEDDRPPWDEVQTFYLPCCGKAAFFERTMEEVVQAEYHINRNLALRGEVTLNEFLSFLRLDAVEEGNLIGWDCYIGETQYGYRWIDFDHRHYVTDDGLTVCSIDTPFAPHSLDDPEYDGEDKVSTCGVD